MGKDLIILCVQRGLGWQRMKRTEAIALLKELAGLELIQPSMVLIEQRCPDKYQLCVKGFYNLQELRGYTQIHNLGLEEDRTRDILCIFKP